VLKKDIVTDYKTASQYTSANSASNIWILLPGRLGPDSILQSVSDSDGTFAVDSVLTPNSNYSRTKAILLCSAIVLLFGGLEALLILTLRVISFLWALVSEMLR
jgi:hypothetical protein